MDDKGIIVFNGMIYNYLEVKKLEKIMNLKQNLILRYF